MRIGGGLLLAARGHKFRIRIQNSPIMVSYSLNDCEGIWTPAGVAQWISGPSPWPLGHTVTTPSRGKRTIHLHAVEMPEERNKNGNYYIPTWFSHILPTCMRQVEETKRKSEPKIKTIIYLPYCAQWWCAFPCSTWLQDQYLYQKFSDRGFVFPQRQRGDSNPCGHSPMDFGSIPLAIRAHCHDMSMRNTHWLLAYNKQKKRKSETKMEGAVRCSFTRPHLWASTFCPNGWREELRLGVPIGRFVFRLVLPGKLLLRRIRIVFFLGNTWFGFRLEFLLRVPIVFPGELLGGVCWFDFRLSLFLGSSCWFVPFSLMVTFSLTVQNDAFYHRDAMGGLSPKAPLVTP